MKGPAPKAPHLRSGHHGPSASAHEFEATSEPIVPTLPEGYDPHVYRWWAAVQTDPIASEYLASDWCALISAAALLDGFCRTGRVGYLSEFRAWCREFGLGPMARRSLQWTIRRVEPTKAAPAPRKSARSTLSVLYGGRPESVP